MAARVVGREDSSSSPPCALPNAISSALRERHNLAEREESDAMDGGSALTRAPAETPPGALVDSPLASSESEKARRKLSTASFAGMRKNSLFNRGDREKRRAEDADVGVTFLFEAAHDGGSGAVVSQRVKQLLADVDTEEALAKLAEGSFLLKWCKKNFKKPHERFFFVDARAMALKWKSPRKQESFTTIPVCEVQRIIPGEDTDFGRNKSEKALSIEIVTRARVLHIACHDEKEWKLWMKGLLLYHDIALGQLANRGASDFISLQWHTAQKDADGKIDHRHLHQLLKKLNTRADSRYVEELFLKHDTENCGRLGFTEFRELLNELLIRPDVDYYFAVYKVPQEDYIDEEGFRRFLREVQKVTSDEDLEEELTNFRNADEAFRKPGPNVMLTALGLGSLLCSEANKLMAPLRQKVHQDMSLPLCNYWVKSSHNTYLCGDQVVGRSAVGQYIDALLRGCRCVELDCWDGSDGEPSLFHGVGGYQLTSRIKFKDVIQACRDYGFQRSKFPIILSLEMHCSTNQRIRIAQILDEILQDQIYRCTPTSSQPSPEQLLGKFILKGKVPNERGEMVEEGDEEDLQLEEMELRMAKSLELLGDGAADPCEDDISTSFLHALEPAQPSAFVGTTGSSVSRLSQTSSFSSLANVEGGEGSLRLVAASSPAPSHSGGELLPAARAKRGTELRQGTSTSLEDIHESASGYSVFSHDSSACRRSNSFAAGAHASSASSSSPAAAREGADGGPPQALDEARGPADAPDAPDAAEASEQGDGRRVSRLGWRRARTLERLSEGDICRDARGARRPGGSEAETDEAALSSRSARRGRVPPGSASAASVSDAKSDKLKYYYRNIAMRGKKLKGFDQPRNPMDICSMPESRLLKLVKQSPVEFARFNQKYLTRVYPAGTRLASSNFCPVLPWLYGAQVVALNLQSLGSATILNEGRFLENGGPAGGYVLKPAMLRDPQRPFTPSLSELSSCAETPVHLTIKVLSAHQLPRPVADIWKGPSSMHKIKARKNTDFSCPFVSVSVHGLKEDTRSFRTPTVMNNGFNPRWSSPDATFEFVVHAPSVALLMFKVQTADPVRSEFLAAACFPLDAIRQGVRWVPLFDRKFCLLRWSGLLVYCRVVPLERDEATNTWNPATKAGDETAPPPPGLLP